MGCILSNEYITAGHFPYLVCWNDGLITEYTQYDQLYPQVLSLSSSPSLLYGWTSYNQDGNKQGIFTSIFNNNGYFRKSQKLLNDTIVNNDIVGNQWLQINHINNKNNTNN